MARIFLSDRRFDDAETFGIDHVDAGVDLGDSRFLGLWRVEERADESDLPLDVRIDLAGAGKEGIDQPVHFRNAHRRNGADRA